MIEVIDTPIPLVTWARCLRWSADVYESLFDDDPDRGSWEDDIDGDQSIHMGVGDDQYVITRDWDGMILDGYRVTETDGEAGWRNFPGNSGRTVYHFERLDDGHVDALLEGLFRWARKSKQGPRS